MTDEAAGTVTLVPDLDAARPIPDTKSWLVLDVNGVVLSAVRSNVMPLGGQEIDAAVFADAFTRPGRCALVGGVLVDRKPDLPPASTPIAVPKTGLVRALMARDDWQKVKALIASNSDTQDIWDATSTVVLADPLTQGIITAMAYDGTTVQAIMLEAIAA